MLSKPGRGANLAAVRSRGSPATTTPQNGPCWPFSPTLPPRETENSLLVAKDAEIEKLKKVASNLSLGIILEVADEVPGHEYMIKFLDGQVRDDLVGKDIRSVDAMKPDWTCWVPKSVLKRSMLFSQFSKIAENYHAGFESDFDIYSRGELVIEEESNSDSEDMDV